MFRIQFGAVPLETLRLAVGTKKRFKIHEMDGGPVRASDGTIKAECTIEDTPKSHGFPPGQALQFFPQVQQGFTGRGFDASKNHQLYTIGILYPTAKDRTATHVTHSYFIVQEDPNHPDPLQREIALQFDEIV